jgi:uncharacterized protein involved in type VI secretion and phage assembly
VSADQAAIAGVRLSVEGRPLDDALASRLVEVRVEDHLLLPDTFLVRVADPGLEHMDDHPFAIGARVEIAFGGTDGTTLVPLMDGQVTALEPEFGRSGATIAARGLDASHRLNRSPRNETYQNSTVADIVRKVAGRAGLQVGELGDAGGVHDFVQQSNETDWQFLQRLADRVGHEVVVAGRTLSFRRLASAQGERHTLRWGDNLLSFAPRVTGVRQVEEVHVRGWDPSGRRAIEATAPAPAPAHRNGVPRERLVQAMDGGRLVVADATVTSQEEADALARGMAQRMADGYVEAVGLTRGDPGLRAGRPVRVEGVGRRFSGDYVLSSAEHVYRGGKGYLTHLRIAGKERRGVAQMVAGAHGEGERRWGATGVVIGTVTQNDDPDGLGRVRVRYPALGEDTEGWWARIASPAAGRERGLLMTPQVDDEVAVLFENGDPRRPYVVGALWNGRDRPGDDLARPDGSFALRSDEDVTVRAAKALRGEGVDVVVLTSGDSTVTLKKDGTIEVTGRGVSIKASGGLTLEASQSVRISGMGVTIDGGAGTVRVSGSQVQLG